MALNSQHVIDGISLAKSPADVMATVVGATDSDRLGTALSVLGIVETFASIAIKKIPVGTGLAITTGALVNKINNAGEDIDEFGYIKDSTIIGINSDVLALIGAGALIASSPVVGALGLVSATGLAVYGALQAEAGSSLYDTYTVLFEDIKNQFTLNKNELQEIIGDTNSEQFVDDTISVSSNLKNQYNDYFDGTTQSLDYSDWLYDSETAISLDENQTNQIPMLLDIEIEKLKIDTQTYNIKTLTPLEQINALEEIPEVSFLLSNVNLQIGDKLDLGSSGIYTVESGDTLSVIAQRLEDGTTTKELLQKNTWLIDENRVTFSQNKVLVSTDANDLTEKNHTLIGDIDAENILIDSNNGEDTLVGGDKADTMKGGDGFDTYIAGLGDEITDSDGKGNIKLDGIDLSGRKIKLPNTDMYEDETYVYEEINGTLVVTKKQDGGKLTINEWSNEELGINLSENNNIEINVSDASALASEGAMVFLISLSRPLNDGEKLSVNVFDETLNFESGEQTKTYTYIIQNNVSKTFTVTPKGIYEGIEDVNVIINQGTGTVIAVKEDDARYDPLALDTSKDGFISTSSLEDSNTYFDITGDGLRERVGWIKDENRKKNANCFAFLGLKPEVMAFSPPTEFALLAYDKNENKQIDGINEVFGNLNESGFAELKRLIDSNHDNVINRRDELYQRLQVWNDTNQDAKVQENELQSLSEAGIKEIDLNIVETNIEINGNLISEASHYTDSENNLELAADVQLAFDQRISVVDPEDLPDLELDVTTVSLANLRGYGLVMNSFYRYNLDEEFKTLAKEYTQDVTKVSGEFDTFLDLDEEIRRVA